MKRFIVSILAVLLLSVPLTANAFTTSSGTTSAPAPSSGGGGGGGGGGSSAPPASGSSGSSSGKVDLETGDLSFNTTYPWSTYTPKVTYIKSVNAALANYDSAPVYFMPQLADFPTPLENVVSDLTDNTGVRHQFAAVYTGYFDSDVTYISAQASNQNNARIRTSKKVYSAEDNSRLLNLLGYDLLLQREAFNIEVENGQIEMTYLPTRIPTNELTANTCVMDLYKAMNVYEWDIEFAYGVDKNLDIEKSPIIQMIPALTSGKENKGYDTSESVVWVAATRTNPDQYWNRCLQDAIFDGGLHNITAPTGSFIGSESSVSFTLNSGDQVSLGQFCALARAIMNLYGEPVMTTAEQEACLLAYGVVLPKDSYTKEIRDSIIYLAAKGIIDPAEKNFNKNVTFADIEDILLRIADVDSRLTVKTQDISMLSSLGFSSVNRVSVSSGETPIEIIDAEDLQYRDFLVEVNDYTIFYMLRSTQGFVPQTASKPTASYQPLVTSSASSNPVATGERAQSTENIAILYNNEPMTQRAGFWRNVGIEEYTDIGGKPRVFYHFKINPDQFGNIHFVSADTYEDGTGTEFTLANSNGGIYYYDNGWKYETFGDYNFDDTYRDSTSTSFTDFPIPLSTSKQMAGLYVSGDLLDKAREHVTADPAYKWDSFFNQNGTIKTNERVTIDNSLMAIAFEVPNTSMYRIELYGTNINKVMQTTFMSILINGGAVEEHSNIGFYRAEDNTLLVSVNYLQSQRRVLFFNEEDKNVYVLGVNSVLGSSSKVSTNVVIYDDDTHGFIMVGDTLFPRKDGEVLIEQVGQEYYINAKALTGWAADLVILPTGNNSCAVAIDATLYNRTSGNEETLKPAGSAIDVYTMVDGSSSVLGVLRDVDVQSSRSNNNFNGGGFMLSSAYPLANYCLVMADDNGKDYLFVYHIRGLEGSLGESQESSALDMFSKLTGFQLEADPTYYLMMYELDRATHSAGVFGGTNRNTYYVNRGSDTIHFVSRKLHGKAIGEVEVTYGWTYSPTKTDNILEAAKEYAKGNSTAYMLPFAVYNYKCYDINMNVCKASPTASDFEPIGVLPSYMFGNASEKIGTLDKDLKVTHANPPSGNNFSDYKVTAAPVGNFALFKASADNTIEKLNHANLYWGTVKVGYNSSKKKITIGRVPIELDVSTPVIRTYMGSGANSVYVIQTSQANVAKLLDNASDLIDALINRDAKDLVDWDKYTFNRLIENLDSWSSIILIFILNILPRVCILLFFALMLLALIKDFRLWRNFCNNVFDVYKFLTLGHQSVETIDVKRTFLTSIICLALFYMIMDGALFNFILWICEFVLTLMQN